MRTSAKIKPVNLMEKYAFMMISHQESILSALKKMDEINKKLLIVTRGNKFHSLVSIGDIQRAIIRGIRLEEPIDRILRKNIRIAHATEDIETIKARMQEHRAECMPVIDAKRNLVAVYFWEEMFPITAKRDDRKLDLPVVIMAGGQGTRLKPLTNVLPKALIPVGEKTILENIMDRFEEAGCSDFYLSVNYKAEMIKHYLGSLPNQYKVKYLEEKKPLGTAGSLFFLKNKIKSAFFISNCDIIIDQELREIFDYHTNNRNEMTVVGSLKHLKIPYGTIETGAGGKLLNLKEKPELTFIINSGMYLLEASLLDEIPNNTFFHITDLIEKIKDRKGRVGVFPVSEKSWLDIGEWNEYLQTLAQASKIK